MEQGSSGTKPQAWTIGPSDRFRCPAPLWPFRTLIDLTACQKGTLTVVSGDPAVARISGEAVAIRMTCDDDPTVRRTYLIDDNVPVTLFLGGCD